MIMANRQKRAAHDPTDAPLAHPDEPGAYIGTRPERQAETTPGGVHPGDERIAGHSSSRAPVRDESDAPPEHREAGQDR